MEGAKVFISYSDVDVDFAIKLSIGLTKEGFVTWIDKKNVLPGLNWDDEIQNALHTSTTVIVILSTASVASMNVKNEIQFSIERKINIIPIMLEECIKPLAIARYHHIDFTQNYQPAFSILCNTLEHNLVLDKSDGLFSKKKVKKIERDELFYKVGDRCDGGIIFYLYPDTNEGLIVSPDDLGIESWETAIKKCKEYEIYSYENWHLPTLFELRILYNASHVIKGFAQDFYWSMGESKPYDAYCKSFASGFEVEQNQKAQLRFRAIRHFKESF